MLPDYLKVLHFDTESTNLYLIVDGGEAALIDAHVGYEADVVLDAIRKNTSLNRLRQVILTHWHYDHVGACPRLYEEYGVIFLAHKMDAPYIENPWQAFLFLNLYRTPTVSRYNELLRLIGGRGVKIDRLLQDGNAVEVGSVKLRVICSPGHSHGSICLYDPVERMLFSGDVLTPSEWFQDWLGLVVDARSHWESLQMLDDLPIELMLRGHVSILDGNDARTEVVKHIDRFKAIELEIIKTLKDGAPHSLVEITDEVIEGMIGERSRDEEGLDKATEYITVHSFLQKLCYEGKITQERGNHWRTL